MKRNRTNKTTARLLLYTGCLIGALAQTSCDIIDDDLSDCGTDFVINYDVHMTSNKDAEMARELTTAEEQLLAPRLDAALADYFVARVHDLDLSFFAATDGIEENHNRYTIDAGHASYTFYLPQQDYRHLALGHTTAQPNVPLVGTGRQDALGWRQPQADSIESHAAGLFSARTVLSIDSARQKRTFQVDLYQQNSAVAVVIDPADVSYRHIRSCLVGLASGFTLNDSTYTFAHSAPVRMERIADSGSQLICLYGKAFPSRDDLATRAVANSEDEALWMVDYYVALADGTTTATRWYIPERLLAGNLYILKGYLLPNGEVVPTKVGIGMGVKLDWRPGGIFEPVM
ncbi:MAG: FimB/Mfa2 family fimbrial subunit [Prevotella sp.]|nr:FimB/Mfa2 family fimbrial subunit [Prevotella sp.]